jgi:hypothetical protein
MNKLFIIGTLLFLIVKGYGIDKSNELKTKNKDSLKEGSVIDLVHKKEALTLSIPEKITIENSNHLSESDKNDWSKNMPWIGAIVIGILTVGGNFIVSKYNRDSNNTVAFSQMENAKTIASQQMEQLRINSERDFNKTVLSASRQLWINDFRVVISELLSLVSLFIDKQKMPDDNTYKLDLLIIKAELMLTNESSQIELRMKLGEIKKCCFDIMADNKNFDDLINLLDLIKTRTLQVIEEELEKAKKGL